MNLVHSFWTIPMLAKRWEIDKQVENNLWYSTLSIIYAKCSGAKINLHTDDLGYDLLKHLPYDNIYKTLNEIPKNVPNMMWACGKFFAMEHESLGNIHIDNDVFIKSDKCIKILDFKNYDGIVQNIEYNIDKYKAYNDAFNYLKENNIRVNYNNINSYCCGIIGFNNKHLKNIYHSNYFNNLEKVININNINPNDKYICLDLVLEQAELYDISNNKFNIKSLLDWNIDNNSTRLADSINFQHVMGRAKYFYIDKVKQLVKYYDKQLYELTSNIITDYERN